MILRKLHIAIFIFVLGCTSSDFMPKPKGYNRIIFLNMTYVSLPDTLPYYFMYSKHAKS
jgi:hypothetical protein